MNTVLLLLVLFRFLLSVPDLFLLCLDKITPVQLPGSVVSWWFFLNTIIQEKKNAVKPIKFFAILFVILVLYLAHCVKTWSAFCPHHKMQASVAGESKSSLQYTRSLQLLHTLLIIHGQPRCTFFLGSFLLKLKHSLSPGICTVKCLEIN